MSTNPGRVNRQFSANELKDIATALDLLDQSFSFSRGLSPRDQRRLVRIGTSNKKFVQTVKHAVDNVAVLPGYVSMTEFQNEYAIFFQIEALLATLRSFEEKLRQTQLVAGKHLMNDCLDVYKTMESAVNRGFAEVVPYYEEVKKRFEGQGRRSSSQKGSDPVDPPPGDLSFDDAPPGDAPPGEPSSDDAPPGEPLPGGPPPGHPSSDDAPPGEPNGPPVPGLPESTTADRPEPGTPALDGLKQPFRTFSLSDHQLHSGYDAHYKEQAQDYGSSDLPHQKTGLRGD